MCRCCDQQPQIRSQLAASTDCWTSKWMSLWKIPVPNPGLTSSLLFLWKVVFVFPSVGCRRHQQRQAISTRPFQILIHRTREHNKIVFVLHVYVYTSTSTWSQAPTALPQLTSSCVAFPLLIFYHWLLVVGGKVYYIVTVTIYYTAIVTGTDFVTWKWNLS